MIFDFIKYENLPISLKHTMATTTPKIIKTPIVINDEIKICSFTGEYLVVLLVPTVEEIHHFHLLW